MLDNDTIRETIKTCKKQNHMTWGEIADKAGIGESTLHKFIYNQNAMRTELVSCVLEVLGLELCIRPKQ